MLLKPPILGSEEIGCLLAAALRVGILELCDPIGYVSMSTQYAAVAWQTPKSVLLQGALTSMELKQLLACHSGEWKEYAVKMREGDEWTLLRYCCCAF